MQRKKDYIYNPREFRRSWQKRFPGAALSPKANDDWDTPDRRSPSRWLVFALGVVVGLFLAGYLR